jgi:glycosyltransferase involved in cell wall biosynthesis
MERTLWFVMDYTGGIADDGFGVSIIVPARNEEDNILHVLPELLEKADELLVVDGHSTDRTVEVARSLSSKVRVIHQEDSGKGSAIRLGIGAAVGSSVLVFDADYSHDPADVPRILERLKSGYDVVHGSRFASGGGSADNTLLRNLGNRGLTFVMNLICGTSYTDVCYGLFGFNRDAAKRLGLKAKEFDVEVEILCKANILGLRIAEIPCFERRRLHGGSHFNGVLVGLRNVLMMLRASPRWLKARGSPSGVRPAPGPDAPV